MKIAQLSESAMNHSSSLARARGAPVRLALTGHHAPDLQLTVLVRVVGNDHVVLHALRVDVVALKLDASRL